MKLRKLELENWCQHEHLVLDINNGLIGILGPNGSGKSNIIRALVYALTGYVTGTRSDYLKHGAQKGRVAIEFCADESMQLYRVERNVHNADVTAFRFNGTSFDSISDRSATARDFIEQVIHISPDVAQQIFAVPQEDMVALFRETPAKRNEILQRVFSLQFFLRIRKKLAPILSDADAKAQDLKSRILLLEDQERAKVKYLTTFQELPSRSCLENFSKQTSEEMEQLTRSLGSVQLRAYLNAELQRGESERAAVLQRLAEPAPESSEDINILSENIEKEQAYLKRLDSALPVVKAFLGLEVPEPLDPESVQRVEENVETLTGKVQTCRNRYDHIVSCGTTGTCPTCGGPTTFTEADLRKAQEEYTVAFQNLETLKRTLKDLRAVQSRGEKLWALYTRRREDAQMTWSQFSAEELTIGSLDFLERESADCRARLESLKTSRKNWEEYQRALERWRDSQDTLRQQLAGLDQNLTAIRSNPEFLRQDEICVPKLTQRKQALQGQLENLKQQLIQRIQQDAAECELTTVREGLQDLRKKLAATHPELRRNLQTLSDCFASKNLPAKVAYDIYRILAVKLNTYLAEFEAPYSVELNSGGDFVCVFSRGMRQLASRLSGGEKMLLSVAFRLALHSVFAADDSSGFIMLDEPTTFLDEKNREALVHVLGKLKTSPIFSGLQIFVVTHDEMLRPLFTSVVELGVPS